MLTFLFLIGALFVLAIAYWSYQAGKLAARKERTQYTLGEALGAYSLSMVGLVGSLVAFAWVLEKVL